MIFDRTQYSLLFPKTKDEEKDNNNIFLKHSNKEQPSGENARTKRDYLIFEMPPDKLI